jgi:predicted nucleic acid-binding protein
LRFVELQAKGRRHDRLQRAEAAFDPLPFDVEAARAYGRIAACDEHVEVIEV